MRHTYAYSYDRQDFTGCYDTPEAAFDDAVDKSQGLASPPAEIFIGIVADADPQTDGHAAAVVEKMRRRALVDGGDRAAHYLADVSPEQLEELDIALSATIRQWLTRTHLAPRYGQIRAVRECPVTNPGSMAAQASDSEIVGEIGVADQVGEPSGV